MVVFGNQKYACLSCIRGHRSSSCDHRQRILLQVRKPGRRSQAELKSRYVLVWKESTSPTEPTGQYKLMKVPEEDVSTSKSRTPSIPNDPKEQITLEDNDDEVVLTDKYVFVHVGNNLFRRELKPSYIDGTQRKIENAAPGTVTTPLASSPPESSGRCCKQKSGRSAEPVKRTPDRRMVVNLDHMQALRNGIPNQPEQHHPSITARLVTSSSPISPANSENGYSSHSHPHTPLRATSVPVEYQNSHNGNMHLAGGQVPLSHPQISVNQAALPLMPLNGLQPAYSRNAIHNPNMPPAMQSAMGPQRLSIPVNGAPGHVMPPNVMHPGSRQMNGLHPNLHAGNMPLNMPRPPNTMPHNGMPQNPMSPNGISPNGMSSNGMSPNGISPNGMAAHGTESGTLPSNGMRSNSISAAAMQRSPLQHASMHSAAAVRTPQPSPNQPGSSDSLHHSYVEPKQEIDTINDELDDLFIAGNNNAPLVIGPMQFQQDGENTRSNILNELGITEQEASELWPQTEYNPSGHFTYAAQCVLPGQCQCGEGCQCPDCYEHRRGRHNTFG